MLLALCLEHERSPFRAYRLGFFFADVLVADQSPLFYARSPEWIPEVYELSISAFLIDTILNPKAFAFQHKSTREIILCAFFCKIRVSGVDSSRLTPTGIGVPMTPSEEVYSLIPLRNSQLWSVAPIDLWIGFMGYRWRAKPTVDKNIFYACRMTYDPSSGRRYEVFMHREVMGLKFGDPGIVDHINHDTLDNRRSNLRIVTPLQNMQNKRRHKTSRSGFKGVQPYGLRWKAIITVNYEQICLGVFDTPEGAHAAYCAAAIKYFGEYACFE